MKRDCWVFLDSLLRRLSPQWPWVRSSETQLYVNRDDCLYGPLVCFEGFFLWFNSLRINLFQDDGSNTEIWHPSGGKSEYYSDKRLYYLDTGLFHSAWYHILVLYIVFQEDMLFHVKNSLHFRRSLCMLTTLTTDPKKLFLREKNIWNSNQFETLSLSLQS